MNEYKELYFPKEHEKYYYLTVPYCFDVHNIKVRHEHYLIDKIIYGRNYFDSYIETQQITHKIIGIIENNSSFWTPKMNEVFFRVTVPNRRNIEGVKVIKDIFKGTQNLRECSVYKDDKTPKRIIDQIRKIFDSL